MMLARLLLTLVTLGYSLIPVLADFNKTHATNPSWTRALPRRLAGIKLRFCRCDFTIPHLGARRFEREFRS
jgi:hypothetical protein